MSRTNFLIPIPSRKDYPSDIQRTGQDDSNDREEDVEDSHRLFLIRYSVSRVKNKEPKMLNTRQNNIFSIVRELLARDTTKAPICDVKSMMKKRDQFIQRFPFPAF